MRFTKKMKYNIKHALPMLAIAGAGLMASCDSDDDIPQHDVELTFSQDNYGEVSNENITRHAQDPEVRTIYLTVIDGYYANANTQNLNNLCKSFTKKVNIAPHKIRGRGNFQFAPGVVQKSDSLWFVQQGWTINKQNQK